MLFALCISARFQRLLVCSIAYAAISAVPAQACPTVGGLPDYNCDEKVDIAVLGDSLVYGFGDTKNKNRGGYVLRTQKKFSHVKFNNFGVQGQRTMQLLDDLEDAFSGKAEDRDLYEALLEADVVFLDLGRNDRWLFGTPSATFRNLKRISSFIKKNVSEKTGIAPLVITAVLMLPNRGSQGPWVKELDQLILRSNSKNAPADLRFDLVSKRLIGTDQIHPTSEGYNALAKTFISYLSKNLLKKVAALRPDADHDGVYDYFEINRFGTDPARIDSDGDGFSDQNEIFSLGTNPLSAE